ncbi:trypsin-like serine protease [Streptomyces sp. NPDC059477]|uniref:trypsin-like serine protease n=1 Tax=Streptomyces sp. NPDC059477 TaxID=3346847 RepID=UPI00367F9A09
MHRPRTRAALTSGLLAATVVASALTAAPAQAASGSPAASGSYAFTARLAIGSGDRVCSGTLVDPQWVISAGSCFVDNPAAGTTPPAGPPTKPVTVTVGRGDLASTGGHITTVTELVPAPGRDLVMARLAAPAQGITPVTLATTPPATGDTVRAAGFGRTATEWSPMKLHTGSFTVDGVDTNQLAITGQSGNALCAGDTGGPLLREKDGKTELIGVNSKSWQGGCWGTDTSEVRKGAISTRTDDLNAWLQQVRALPQQAQVVDGDFDGDGKSDVAALYDYGKDAQGRAQSSLWVFKSDGTTFRAPRVAWDSGATSWTWALSKVTSGDYNGDGKTDIAVLYDYDQTADGKNHSRLWWAFTSTGTTFNAPTVAWDSGTMSWNWDSSKVTSGDYNGDGKTDIGVLYNNGLIDGKNRTRLWAFTSTGTALQAPKIIWDSDPTSWSWDASQPLSGDITGDGKTDMAIFYDYGTTTDGRTRQALWNLTSTGDTMTAPRRDWDSTIQ